MRVLRVGVPQPGAVPGRGVFLGGSIDQGIETDAFHIDGNEWRI